jgi:hypothetical protein
MLLRVLFLGLLRSSRGRFSYDWRHFSSLPHFVPLWKSSSVVQNDDSDYGGDGLLQSAYNLTLVTVHHRRVRLPNLRRRLHGIEAPELIKTLFPGAVHPSSYLQPNTGHALTLHYNASAGFQVIFDYLTENGL